MLAADLVRRWFVLATTTALVLAAFLLVARRLAGALTQPLSAMALVAVGMAVVGGAIAVRALSRQRAVDWSLNAAVVLIALAVSLPGSSWLGLVILWLLVVGEEIAAWRLQRGGFRHRGGVDQPPTSVAGYGDLLQLSEEVEPTADWADAAIAQQLKYGCSAEGEMSVEGWLRAEFVAGQRTGVVHVAFCPAFARVPQVEAEPLDGPACEIRPTLVLPWGIRWEVKLEQATTEATSVVLGFVATEVEIP